MATGPRVLRSYSIGWALPHVDHPFGAERGLTRGEAVRAVNLAIMAFAPLTALVTERLGRAKAALAPEIGWASSEISPFEGAGLALVPVERGKPWKVVSRYYLDPLKLLDIPADRRERGELAIAIAEAFVEEMEIWGNLGFVAGFPRAVFEEAIAEFRAADYAISRTTAAKKLDGTALRVRYRVEASAGETTITMVILKGRTEIHERVVRTIAAGLLDQAAAWTSAARVGDDLVVHGLLPGSVEPSLRIPLDDLPAEVRAHL